MRKSRRLILILRSGSTNDANTHEPELNVTKCLDECKECPRGKELEHSLLADPNVQQ
jgi:hypothetical protein